MQKIFDFQIEDKAEIHYFPYKIFEKGAYNYYSILKYYNHDSIMKYDLQKYILKEFSISKKKHKQKKHKQISKINTLKPVYAFIVREDNTIFYVSHNEVRSVSPEGEDTLINDQSNFLVDIKEDTEGNIIVLDKHTSLLKKISTEGIFTNITDGTDIIFPNSIVIVEKGYLVGDKKFIWFVSKSGSKFVILHSDIRTDLAVGYDNLYLRDKKITFTYQMDEKTTYEICEYDSVSNKYYYLLNENNFKKLSKKKSEILQGFRFQKDKLIFWSEKGFAK